MRALSAVRVPVGFVRSIRGAYVDPLFVVRARWQQSAAFASAALVVTSCQALMLGLNGLLLIYYAVCMGLCVAL